MKKQFGYHYKGPEKHVTRDVVWTTNINELYFKMSFKQNLT